MVRNPSKKTVDKALNDLLEGDYWIDTLAVNEFYSRLHDDTDGKTTSDHALEVLIAEDLDMHIIVPGQTESLRFRNYLGGGSSLRVRNALLVLAEAMRRDNAERPQRPIQPYIPSEE